MTPDRTACLAWVQDRADKAYKGALFASEAELRSTSTQEALSWHQRGMDDADDANHFDALAALLEAQQWQPITTAPKDGTPVVLYMGDWLEPCFLAAHYAGASWLVGQHATVDGPTHWFPLPLPVPPPEEPSR
ncbi:MAG: hypothetical protein NUW22_05035 [Acidobacteria bacterium]|nr:hypothetical protein [Acidobacteriota bacterium]